MAIAIRILKLCHVDQYTKDKIYIVSGDPANSTGNEDSLSRPQLLPSNIGMLNFQSIVSIPDGLIFQSSNGIWLLDRGLNVTFLGSNIFDYSDNIVSAVVLPVENKVLLSSNNYTLVYDYYLKFWCTYPNIGVKSGVIWNEKHCFLDSKLSNIMLSNTEFTDNTSGIKTLIETGWLSLSGIQGYQRIYNILFLGEYVGSHKFIVEVYYNFNEGMYDNFSIDSGVVVGSSYGSSTTFGSETPFGSTDGVLQFKLKPTIQKCTSIKLKIFDANIGTGGFKISHIAFECGTVGTVRRFTSDRNLT